MVIMTRKAYSKYVVARLLTPVRARLMILPLDQMEEKKWAHRRSLDGSTVLSDSISSLPGFGLSAICEALQPQMNEDQTAASSSVEDHDEDKVHTAEPILQCARFLNRFEQLEHDN
jgi:hypothetical protein